MSWLKSSSEMKLSEQSGPHQLSHQQASQHQVSHHQASQQQASQQQASQQQPSVQPASPQPLPASVAAEPLEVSGVGISLGGRRILRDVSFSVPAGSMTAIVGVNGVGKSTLLRGIAGISSLAEGAVHLGSSNVHGLSHRARARRLAFTAQEEFAFGDLRVMDVVHLARVAYRSPWSLSSAQDNAIVSAALAQVGLESHAERPMTQLSGGQRRRVLIARSIAQSTGVMLLDEPTNHLDVHHQLNLLTVLRETGRTVVATVHDLDLAMCFFDQMVVLNEGTVRAAGPPDEALTPEIVREAFNVQALTIRPECARHTHLVVDRI